MQSYPLNENWLIKNVELKHLAPACGFSLIAPSSTKVLQSMDASYMATEDVPTVRLFLPRSLAFMYQKENTAISFTNLQSDTAWKLLEETIVQSLSLTTGGVNEATFGQRYEFLRTSFIANVKHTTRKAVKGPSMRTQGELVQPNSIAEVPIDQLARYHRTLHVENWPDLLNIMDDNYVVWPEDLSHGPDAFAKLNGNADSGNRVCHLLCFQAKYGKQNLSFWDVLDELGKCPFVSVKKVSVGFVLTLLTLLLVLR